MTFVMELKKEKEKGTHDIYSTKKKKKKKEMSII